jgi:hypothetical protein
LNLSVREMVSYTSVGRVFSCRERCWDANNRNLRRLGREVLGVEPDVGETLQLLKGSDIVR